MHFLLFSAAVMTLSAALSLVPRPVEEARRPHKRD